MLKSSQKSAINHLHPHHTETKLPSGDDSRKSEDTGPGNESYGSIFKIMRVGRPSVPATLAESVLEKGSVEEDS